MSEQTFEVGEVAIVVHSSVPEFPVGSEVTILEVTGCRAWDCRVCRGDGTVRAYVVGYVPDGGRIVAHGYTLRKKRPPREDLKIVRWSECPWQPRERKDEIPNP